ncbi:MAG TPA: hypothetical protein VGR78_10915, partial [Verrucomicrobiae bacterium]|nr:hypothetical protein [Verrucomicrobiae bacterium]
MIKPIHQDEDILADVQRARAKANQFHLWWLGRSAFLLESNGWHPDFGLVTKEDAGMDKTHIQSCSQTRNFSFKTRMSLSESFPTSSTVANCAFT